MDGNHNSFQYTYSAPQNEEVKKIREKYLPKEENKLEKLRRLDETVTKKAQAYALTQGLISALILGAGVGCVMLHSKILFIPGILMVCIGVIGMALSHPLHNWLTKRERERLAPEILKLANELINGQA